MLDQATRLRQLAFENDVNKRDMGENTKVFTITSGKGGVGKSNVVLNLAIALKKLGKKVLVLDADIGMGNIDVLIGTIPRYNIIDIVSNNKTIEEVMITGPLGVKILCGGTGLSRIDDLNSSQREIIVNQLGRLRGFDYILIDTGAGINRTSLAFIDCSDEVFIVTTPEPTALTDAYSLLKTMCNYDIKRSARVIVNKVLEDKEGDSTFGRLKNSSEKFLHAYLIHLGNVCEDKKLVQAVRQQKPVLLAYPNCEASQKIEALARKLEGIEGKRENSIQVVFKKMFKIFS